MFDVKFPIGGSSYIHFDVLSLVCRAHIVREHLKQNVFQCFYKRHCLKVETQVCDKSFQDLKNQFWAVAYLSKFLCLIFVFHYIQLARFSNASTGRETWNNSTKLSFKMQLSKLSSTSRRREKNRAENPSPITFLMVQPHENLSELQTSFSLWLTI